MPKYFYVTTNHDWYGRIDEDAAIERYKSEKEARAALTPQFDLQPGEWLEFEIGDFGDCWIKLDGPLNPFRVEQYCGPFRRQSLIETPPEHNPDRLDRWWITPSAEIYVPMIYGGQEYRKMS